MTDAYQVCAMPAQIAHEIYTGGAVGQMVRVYLTRMATSPNRRRGVAIYSIAIELGWAPKMGRILLVDSRGAAKGMTYADAADWVGRVMPGRDVWLQIHVEKAGEVSPSWTRGRVAAVQAKAAAIDGAALTAAADAKRATVTQWATSTRKTDALATARALDWCAYFDKARAPGGSLGADRSAGPRGGESGTVDTGGDGAAAVFVRRAPPPQYEGAAAPERVQVQIEGPAGQGVAAFELLPDYVTGYYLPAGAAG